MLKGTRLTSDWTQLIPRGLLDVDFAFIHRTKQAMTKGGQVLLVSRQVSWPPLPSDGSLGSLLYFLAVCLVNLTAERL